MNKEVKTLRKPKLLILYITRVTVLLIFLSCIMFYKKSVHHDLLDNKSCCLLFLMEGETFFFKQHRRVHSKFV